MTAVPCYWFRTGRFFIFVPIIPPLYTHHSLAQGMPDLVFGLVGAYRDPSGRFGIQLEKASVRRRFALYLAQDVANDFPPGCLRIRLDVSLNVVRNEISKHAIPSYADDNERRAETASDSVVRPCWRAIRCAVLNHACSTRKHTCIISAYAFHPSISTVLLTVMKVLAGPPNQHIKL